MIWKMKRNKSNVIKSVDILQSIQELQEVKSNINAVIHIMKVDEIEQLLKNAIQFKKDLKSLMKYFNDRGESEKGFKKSISFKCGSGYEYVYDCTRKPYDKLTSNYKGETILKIVPCPQNLLWSCRPSKTHSDNYFKFNEHCETCLLNSCNMDDDESTICPIILSYQLFDGFIIFLNEDGNPFADQSGFGLSWCYDYFDIFGWMDKLISLCKAALLIKSHHQLIGNVDE